MIDIPSPAVAVVGRHNSGKTTLVVALIEELVARGHDVGSVKHHHRENFEIDIPGKALAEELLIRHVHRDDVLRLKVRRGKILLAVRQELPPDLRVREEPGPAPAPFKRAAEGRGAGHRVPAGAAEGHDENVLVGQQLLGALFIVHRPHPHRV